MLPYALEAWSLLVKEGLRVDLVSVAAWSDLSEGDVRHVARHGRVVTVEDHNPKTGLGTCCRSGSASSGSRRASGSSA